MSKDKTFSITINGGETSFSELQEQLLSMAEALTTTVVPQVDSDETDQMQTDVVQTAGLVLKHLVPGFAEAMKESAQKKTDPALFAFGVVRAMALLSGLTCPLGGDEELLNGFRGALGSIFKEEITSDHIRSEKTKKSEKIQQVQELQDSAMEKVMKSVCPMLGGRR